MVITPASRAIVGEYNLYVETMVSKGGERHIHRKQHEESLIVLFNPWCKGMVNTIVFLAVIVMTFQRKRLLANAELNGMLPSVLVYSRGV